MSHLYDNQLYAILDNIIKLATTEQMQILSITNNTQYRKSITEKYKDFAISYPALFNMVIENPKKFDMNRLKQMLSLRKKIQNNDITYDEANVKIGQQYYDEFAKPIVDKLPEKK
jgi:hypothetical protein